MALLLRRIVGVQTNLFFCALLAIGCGSSGSSPHSDAGASRGGAAGAGGSGASSGGGAGRAQGGTNTGGVGTGGSGAASGTGGTGGTLDCKSNADCPSDQLCFAGITSGYACGATGHCVRKLPAACAGSGCPCVDISTNECTSIAGAHCFEATTCVVCIAPS